MLDQLAEFGGLSAGKCSWYEYRRLGRAGDRMRAYVWDDYALIAAMSGWTPMMFMTRVRL